MKKNFKEVWKEIPKWLKVIFLIIVVGFILLSVLTSCQSTIIDEQINDDPVEEFIKRQDQLNIPIDL